MDLPTITAHVADFLRGKVEQDFAEQCQRLVEDEVLAPAACPPACAPSSGTAPTATYSPCSPPRPGTSWSRWPAPCRSRWSGPPSSRWSGGQLTGQLRGPACFGPGKIHWAESLGASHEIDVGASWFYTDSFTDLPMLERVTHRVAVNPDPRLKKMARSRGWPVEDWMSSLLPPSAVL